jgi:dTDP-glucose pyrophosphorylase
MASNATWNRQLPERAKVNGADYEPINVIIPIGGIGSRFAKQGYRYPKPLINIVGRPMLLWLIDNLSLKPGDTLWMAVNEDVDDEFRIGQLVSKTFTRIDFRLLRLRHQTKGASETVCHGEPGASSRLPLC